MYLVPGSKAERCGRDRRRGTIELVFLYNFDVCGGEERSALLNGVGGVAKRT